VNNVHREAGLLQAPAKTRGETAVILHDEDPHTLIV
jgi:hypothetical protein